MKVDFFRKYESGPKWTVKNSAIEPHNFDFVIYIRYFYSGYIMRYLFETLPDLILITKLKVGNTRTNKIDVNQASIVFPDPKFKSVHSSVSL